MMQLKRGHIKTYHSLSFLFTHSNLLPFNSITSLSISAYHDSRSVKETICLSFMIQAPYVLSQSTTNGTSGQ